MHTLAHPSYDRRKNKITLIEKFWAISGRELSQNFDRGTVYFKHTGVLVSRISTIFNGESLLEIFASFALDKYVRTCSIHTLSR